MTIGSVRPQHPAEEWSTEEPSLDDLGEAPAKKARSFERRQRIVLSCAQCGGRNYRTTKARREGATPLLLKKFCSTCNAHTEHREAV